MKLRKRQPDLNYAKLHRGSPLQLNLRSREIKKTWSPKTLFEVTVLDSRQTDNLREVKVHYPGWSTNFDEWRKESEIVETPQEALTNSGEDFFKFSLLNSIKEKLSCARKKDSEVTITIPVPKESFYSLVTRHNLDCSSKTARNSYYFSNTQLAKTTFMKGWWYRIINKAGDFAHIDLDTFQMWLRERPCLEEYTKEGQLKLTHRGFKAVVRFVVLLGNRFDHNILE